MNDQQALAIVLKLAEEHLNAKPMAVEEYSTLAGIIDQVKGASASSTPAKESGKPPRSLSDNSSQEEKYWIENEANRLAARARVPSLHKEDELE
jgi:hypothetical protein